MLPRRTDPEVGARHQNAGPGELLAVEDEVAVVTPLGEQPGSEPGPLHPLQPVGRDDLIGVHVGPVEGDRPSR